MNNIFEDQRGSLLPINLNKIPFDVKRVFMVYNVPKDTVRGEHAHYETKQFLVCVKGVLISWLFFILGKYHFTSL